MHLLCTLPQCEALVPAAIRPNGERYWWSVDIPLCLDALFLVCTSRQVEGELTDEWLLVVGASKVLDTLERIGLQNVKSLQLVYAKEEPDFGAALTELVAIESVHEAGNPRDRRVRFHTADRCSILLPLPDDKDQKWISSGAAARLQRWKRAAEELAPRE